MLQIFSNDLYIKSYSFICEHAIRLREKQNMPRYQTYIEQGSMKSTLGDMIDKNKVKSFIVDLCATNNVLKICMDMHGAYILSHELAEAAGVEIVRVPQTPQYLSTPIKELETAINEQRIQHDGSAWMRWNIQCVRLKMNSSGGCTIDRDKTSDHIDGISSLLDALAAVCADQAEHQYVRKSVYDERGFSHLDINEEDDAK